MSLCLRVVTCVQQSRVALAVARSDFVPDYTYTFLVVNMALVTNTGVSVQTGQTAYVPVH